MLGRALPLKMKETATFLAGIASLNGIVWAGSPRLCSVHGCVVKAVGEQPLKNARVLLESAEDSSRSFNATTEAEGQLALAEMAPGTYRTLVMVLSKGCHFCEDSAPFYQRLISQSQQAVSSSSVVAVFPDTADAVKEVVQSEGLRIHAPACLSKS